MFDKVSQAAEKLATGVSRRGFLGSVGWWAGATALGLAGVLTTASAGRAGGGTTCCVYTHPKVGGNGSFCAKKCLKLGDPCPTAIKSSNGPIPGNSYCPLSSSYTVSDCGQCG